MDGPHEPMREHMTTIAVEGLTVRYGDTVALDSVGFSARRGSILGILGPNGAGKTTLIRVLATQQRPTSGSVVIAGHDALSERREVQRRIGVTGQYAALDDDLTPTENLQLVAALHGLDSATATSSIERLLGRLELTEHGDRRLSQLSGGTRRRVDLAAGLVTSPEVVFLDEPTTGLDPHSRQQLWHLVRELAADGCTVVLTTQYLEEADQLADHVVVLDRGTIVAAGTPRQLKAAIGGQVIAATLANADDARRVSDAIGERTTRLTAGQQDGRVLAHASDADHALTIVAALDGLDVPLQELAVTTPTLDDAFYALTAR
jgi:daunorubicin resistance ABC transporter ATP-binding subunit